MEVEEQNLNKQKEQEPPLTTGGGVPMGYVFFPKPQELVGYYLYHKIQGLRLPSMHQGVIDEDYHDIYEEEPWQIWESCRSKYKFGDEEEVAYFYTRLRKRFDKGSRKLRQVVGSDQGGTWHGDVAQKRAPIFINGVHYVSLETKFCYMNNPLCPPRAWLMTQHSLEAFPDHAICILKKNKRVRRHHPHHHAATADVVVVVVPSPPYTTNRKRKSSTSTTTKNNIDPKNNKKKRNTTTTATTKYVTVPVTVPDDYEKNNNDNDNDMSIEELVVELFGSSTSTDDINNVDDGSSSFALSSSTDQTLLPGPPLASNESDHQEDLHHQVLSSPSASAINIQGTRGDNNNAEDQAPSTFLLDDVCSFTLDELFGDYDHEEILDVSPSLPPPPHLQQEESPRPLSLPDFDTPLDLQFLSSAACFDDDLQHYDFWADVPSL
ncbi:hypothetical protein Tsubulata_021604 [Turnera subulata]|uniref:NAC domain-containing protein n=1 Tax=Turnera subulata TaxID=218843 RepID=A0A9Q0FVT6_9ROSI|nr:hypothetical protein Tsubulata_021604 [Turnera subulata]